MAKGTQDVYDIAELRRMICALVVTEHGGIIGESEPDEFGDRDGARERIQAALYAPVRRKFPGLQRHTAPDAIRDALHDLVKPTHALPDSGVYLVGRSNYVRRVPHGETDERDVLVYEICTRQHHDRHPPVEKRVAIGDLKDHLGVGDYRG